MNKYLKFSVTFTKPARTINFEQSWLPGLTAITGRNGTGKSLITEMSQYAKFGTVALRSTGDDYKSISVEEIFEVKGVEYKVIRTKNQATLFEGQTPIATGTKPVNTSILEKLGYSYKVFLTANACNQGEIEQLGKMGATDRKKLIDETVGLTALDGLTKFIAAYEKALRDQAKGMQDVLTKPLEVTKPENYIESGVLKTSIKALQVIQNERNILKSKAEVFIHYPVFDLICEDVDQLPIYQEQVLQAQAVASQMSLMMKQYGNLPDLPAKKPALTIEEIDVEEDYLAKYTEWNAKNNLKTRLEGAKVRHECPSCKHEYFDADSRLAELQDLGMMEVHAYNAVQLKNLRSENTAYVFALAKAQEKAKLAKEYADLDAQYKLMPYPLEAISQINKFNLAKANYDTEVALTNKLQEAKDKAIADLKDLRFEGVDAKIEVLASQLTSSIVYETQSAAYKKAIEAYEAYLIKIVVLEADADQWGRAKQAVTDLRAKVKGFLLPSLNKVSSSLINAMTGGELSWVVINDEFEITVEGQNLATLSGAGKSVANLAIRIALGQVLTNSVFSSLSLDEIDASCDDARSGYIAECLRRLTGQIKQIIQISHKQIEADNYVRL